MRALPDCVRNDLALVIEISLILAVADICHAASAGGAFEPERRHQARVIQVRDRSVANRTRVLPVVNQLVVDVGDRQSPVVIDVVDKVVLELGQVHHALVKLLDLELSGEERRVLPFQFVLEIEFEIYWPGISYSLGLGRVLAAISHSQPGAGRACVLRVTVELPRLARQTVLNRKRAARAEWCISAKIDYPPPPPSFLIPLLTLLT